jgi:hypothetical protein
MTTVEVVTPREAPEGADKVTVNVSSASTEASPATVIMTCWDV